MHTVCGFIPNVFLKSVHRINNDNHNLTKTTFRDVNEFYSHVKNLKKFFNI